MSKPDCSKCKSYNTCDYRKDLCKRKNFRRKMNKNLMKAIDVIIMIITIPVMIVFYIPFAIFKGLTSEFVFDEYFNIWRKFLNILLYPIVKYQQRKEHYEELKQKIKYYRKECGRLNDVINELEKVEKEDKK